MQHYNVINSIFSHKYGMQSRDSAEVIHGVYQFTVQVPQCLQVSRSYQYPRKYNLPSTTDALL